MGFVYLISSASGKCKIGRTESKPDKRLKQLQTGACEELNVTFVYETKNAVMVERMLHVRFASKRIHGEWFALSNDDICGFADFCERTERSIEAMADNEYFSKLMRGKKWT